MSIYRTIGPLVLFFPLQFLLLIFSNCNSSFQPGDYIELCNLHAAVFKTPGVTPLDTVELVLHRGTSFGRGVKVLDATANIVELGKLKQDLQKIIAQYASQTSMNVQGNNAGDQVQKKGV